MSLSVKLFCWGVRKLTGGNLKVVCAEFSTLNWAGFVMSANIRACPYLELKTWPKFGPC